MAMKRKRSVHVKHFGFFFSEARSDDRICYYYGTARGCFRGDNCPYVHQSDQGGQKLVYCVHSSENKRRVPEIDSWVPVEVSAIINPGHIYVIFPFGVKDVMDLIKEESSFGDEGYEGSQSNVTDSIEALGDAMNDLYDKMVHRDTDLILPAPGEIVAAQYSQDQYWYRGRVIEVIDPKDNEPDFQYIKVFFVDFGNVEKVPEHNIRQMQPQFLHLPFQAYECFLAIDSSQTNGLWTSESRCFFREEVDGKVLFANILSRCSNTLYINLYTENQDEQGGINIAQLMIDRGYAITAKNTIMSGTGGTYPSKSSLLSGSASSVTSSHDGGAGGNGFILVPG